MYILDKQCSYIALLKHSLWFLYNDNVSLNNDPLLTQFNSTLIILYDPVSFKSKVCLSSAADESAAVCEVDEVFV